MLNLLIKRDRLNQILTLALPIIFGMLSQNVLNLVDTAMVGRLGDAALAAVGLGGFVNFFFQSLLIGLASGVQAIVSRRKGEGKTSEVASALNAGIVTSVIFGVPLTILVYQLIPELMPLLNSDPEVSSQGVPYLLARSYGIIFVGINFSMRGFLNGVNLSKLYMRNLMVMHISNIVISYVLIFGHLGFPEMGTRGAAMGTTISIMIGTLLYIITAYRHTSHYGFLKHWPTYHTYASLIRISLPNSVQQLFFSAGFTALFWIVGRIGTEATAAANVLINVMLVCILPGIGMGIAAATFVGQALGRGDNRDAMAWGWDVAKVATVLLGLLGLPMIFFTDAILSLFITNNETMALAHTPLSIIGAFMAVEGVGLVMLNCLIGAGDTKSVMVISIVVQWIIFLPAAYLIGPVLGYGLLGVWLAQIGYRCLLALVFGTLWRRGNWARISV